ncbi:MAG: hypothetical protein MUP64_12770, partial [Anaerolineae bacterium]|nr:hypothetical protein [Anaerolineae bacterium]
SLRSKATTTPATKHKTGISTQALLDAWRIVSFPQGNWSGGTALLAAFHKPGRAPQPQLTHQPS